MAEYEFHPLADLFPLIDGEEFDVLAADIKKSGLHESIVLFRGKILVGRNRYRALQRLGVQIGEYYFQNLEDCSIGLGGEVDPPERVRNEHALAYVISKNIHRRHLSADKKREVIAKLLKAQPEKSDRAIAKIAKASPTYVGKGARREGGDRRRVHRGHENRHQGSQAASEEA
jgi:ParB-like chromosome segregation protein Spo0J